MALTGYARYCQLDYFLHCAAQKIEDQANSLTFPGRFPNIAYSTLLREKVVKYKKHNKETFSFLLVASLCQLILGNFSFGPFSIVYWISFFVYYVLIWTYCICMVSNIGFHNDYYIVNILFSLWSDNNHALHFAKIQLRVFFS